MIVENERIRGTDGGRNIKWVKWTTVGHVYQSVTSASKSRKHVHPPTTKTYTLTYKYIYIYIYIHYKENEQLIRPIINNHKDEQRNARSRAPTYTRTNYRGTTRIQRKDWI